MARMASNPGGRYFDGYNYQAAGTFPTKGAAKSTAASLRKRGYYARVTKDPRHGWDVWKLKRV